MRSTRIKIADQDREVVQATNSDFPLQRLRTLYFGFHTTSGKVAVENERKSNQSPEGVKGYSIRGPETIRYTLESSTAEISSDK